MQGKLGDRVRLQHILDAITAIESYTADIHDFTAHPIVFDATIRQLSVIGEACNRLSETLRQQHTDIPWILIIGLRNILIHEYFGVDDKLIENIVKSYLPILKIRTEEILISFENEADQGPPLA